MGRIVLTQEYFATVDDDLFPQIDSLKWRILHAPGGRQARRGKDQRLQFYVLELRGSPVPVGSTVEFVNGNKLDCRTENLRIKVTA